MPAVRTYSHGVIIEAGRTFFVAEQTSRDKDENIVCKGDAAGQTRQVLENIGNVIEEVGGRMAPKPPSISPTRRTAWLWEMSERSISRGALPRIRYCSSPS